MIFSLVTCLLSIIRAVFFTINTFVVAIVHSLIMIPIYSIRFIFPQLYVTIESFLYSKAGDSFVPAFTLCPSLKLYSDSLDEIDELSRKRAIVMINHQDTGDVPVMMCLTSYFNVSHATAWIYDKMFKWTQFGIVLQWHCDFSSQEGRNTREQVADKLKRYFSTTFFEKGRKWLVFFPEGGFLKNRGESSRRFAEKNNLPVLYNCCLPRATAFVNAAKALRAGYKPETCRGDISSLDEQVEDIIDVTIGYSGGDLNLMDIVLGTYGKKDIFLNFKTYKMSDLPESDEDLTTWLYDRYVEKEQLLKNFKEKGYFVENKEFSRIRQNSGKILGSLAFWYISAFFVWDFYRCLINNILSFAFRIYA